MQREETHISILAIRKPLGLSRKPLVDGLGLELKFDRPSFGAPETTSPQGEDGPPKTRRKPTILCFLGCHMGVSPGSLSFGGF